MQYHRLPHTTLEISQLGLGTMTFGEQNTEAEAHQQLDYAIRRGINFIDTAEMYPVPPKPATQGLTEQYIGSWLKKTGSRDKILLASKVAGPVRGQDAAFRSDQALDRKNIRAALDESLRRLQTDYLDLYQLHWPQRPTNCFGRLGYQWNDENIPVTLLETLEALTEQVKAGKIRYIGVSNETAWGVMRYLQLAEKHELPRVVSIQNPYSLLNRSFEVGLAEVSQHEGVEFLAYSALAFGRSAENICTEPSLAGLEIVYLTVLPAIAASRRNLQSRHMLILLSNITSILVKWRWLLFGSSILLLVLYLAQPRLANNSKISIV
jgi:aryl-alcohol dehydrogenase-like predicted oxidoreductase